MRLTCALLCMSSCSNRPVDVPDITPTPEDLLVSTNYSTCLARNGTVRCWGENEHGELGDGTTTDHSAPVRLPLTGVKRLSGNGGEHFCALAEGGAYCWGWNSEGQIGDGTLLDRATPTAVLGAPASLADIVAGDQHSCALATDGTIACWGADEFSQVGVAAPVGVPAVLPGLTASAIFVGGDHSCAIDPSGMLECWGADVKASVLVNPQVVWTATPIDAVTCGPALTCIVFSGQVWCLGPDPMNDVSGFEGGMLSVAISADHLCGLDTNGFLSCFGANDHGQLGDGTTRDSAVGVFVAGVGAATQISVGANFSCAVFDDHSVWCWGVNDHGQLGDGTTNESHLPVRVLL